MQSSASYSQCHKFNDSNSNYLNYSNNMDALEGNLLGNITIEKSTLIIYCTEGWEYDLQQVSSSVVIDVCYYINSFPSSLFLKSSPITELTTFPTKLWHFHYFSIRISTVWFSLLEISLPYSRPSCSKRGGAGGRLTFWLS